MILEMHCHTAEHSACSHVNAEALVQDIFDKGLEGVVITDHHYLWPPEKIRALRSRIKVPHYFLILAGQEVETLELGHVLVYGADVAIERGASLRQIRSRFPNAALVWAHPYRDEKVPSREKLLYPLIDAVEIFNSNHTVAESNRALDDWHLHKFTAISGTDTHALSYTALYPAIFDHPVSSVEELAIEIKAGRCRPFFQEIPRSGTSSTRVTVVTIGTKGTGQNAEKFVIKKHKDLSTWRSTARTAHIMEELRGHGFDKGQFRVPKPFARDETKLTMIEQGIHGTALFDTLVQSTRVDARYYMRMSAEWLAQLHNLRLQISSPGEFIDDEPNRLKYYLSAFYEHNHTHTRRAHEIMNTVIDMENALYHDHKDRMIQGHGDYHPKNIFIGRDRIEDSASTFVAAIDFNSSYAMPAAFDVGTFMAQFRNQFYNNKEVLSKVTEDFFLQTYLQHALDLDTDFLSQVELFRARTALSICYHLLKVGLGGSDNLWRVLVEAGSILAHLNVKNIGKALMIEKTA